MRYLVLLLATVFIVGCDNELNLVADHKEIPIVYGLIDQLDTAQYIRVERAFVDLNISANTIAQNPDSLYYEGITVKLVKQSTGEEYTLERVDGNLEGYPRDEGVFATSPNYLYKILTEEIEFEEEEIIELKIEGVFEDRVVTAEADVLPPPFFFAPADAGEINFDINKAVNIGWNPKGDPTIYSAAYTFNVLETKEGALTEKKLKWIVETNTDKTNISILGADFFSFLQGALEDDPQITRVMGLAEFELIAGNTTVADYIRVGQANLGITSSGEIPKFTNLSDGQGVFGSKITQTRRNLFFGPETLDSLRLSPLNENLNFQ